MKSKPANFWELWPLLMGLCFVVMAPFTNGPTFILRALTVVALTYSLSRRLSRRNPSKTSPQNVPNEHPN